MGKVAEPVTTGKVAFDVERFEFADGERFEVGGRWFGVRGRRFMRPSLTLIAGEFETRLLADLAHKPWAAEDGELWEAAFPSTDGWADTQAAELNVGPDVTIRLAVPDGRRKQPQAGRQPRTRPPGAAEHPQSAPRRPRERPDHERALVAARAEIATLRGRIDELSRELREARGESTSELEQARSATAEANAAREQALSARDEALARAEAVEREHEVARSEGEAARSEGEAARSEGEAARSELVATQRERDAALSQLRDAHREREGVVAEHAAVAAALERTVAERDAALAAQAETAADRDELAATSERIRTEHERRATATGAALVMRNAALDSSKRESRWLALAIAGVCVVIVFLVAALLFGLR